MVALGKPDRNREAELRQAIGIRSMSAKSSDPLVSIHSSSTGMLRIIQRPLLAHSIVCFRRLPALSGSNVSTGCFHTCDTKGRDDAVNDGNYIGGQPCLVAILTFLSFRIPSCSLQILVCNFLSSSSRTSSFRITRLITAGSRFIYRATSTNRYPACSVLGDVASFMALF